jgi:hypothetical protein
VHIAQKMSFGVLLLLGVAVAATDVTMKNVDYLASGYDVFKGNPQSSATPGRDPGFRHMIFQFNYSSKLTTDDLRYIIPDRTAFRTNKGCLLDFKSTEVFGSQSYSNSLEVEVDASVEYLGNKFSASSDYRRVQTGTSDQHSVFTTTSASCSVYDGFLNLYDMPDLHDDFVHSILELPDASYDAVAYMKFLDTFGTHFVSDLTMGAKFGFLSEISDDSYKKSLEMHLKLEFAASASAWGISGSAHSMTDEEKQAASSFRQLQSSWSEFVLGTNPPADGKSDSWASLAIEEPMPILYSLKSIEAVLEEESLSQSSKAALSSKNITAIAKNIKRALSDYCPYLRDVEKVVSSCNPSPPDPQPPNVKNSCRWCADSCGGSFPVDGGSISNDKDWPNWAFSYAPGCSEPYDHHGTSSGLKLCCEDEDKDHVGTCRLCESCGGDFAFTGGKMVTDQNWPAWLTAYDNQCDGDMRHRDVIGGNGISVCCQQEPICSFCRSCGGAWPHESGVISYDRGDWQRFFESRGDQCSGDIAHQHDTNQGVKLCCQTTQTSPFTII